MLISLGAVSVKTRGTIFYMWLENGLFPHLTFNA